MLLIVVADLYTGTQNDPSGIFRNVFVYDLQDRSLSGSVIADQCDAFPAFNIDGNVLKQDMRAKGF